MIRHDLVQGSPEWMAWRDTVDSASEAPSMMNESPYTTRNKLIEKCYTGVSEVIDEATQKRFDAGHRFEALARARAAEIIGESVYAVCGSLEGLGASFDGLTMLDDIAWEHKTLNNEIRAAACAEELPIYLRIQMEQQLHISGAEKCLFHATKWNDDGALTGEIYFWYMPDLILRGKILAGWEQFHRDLAAYVPSSIVEMPRAEVVVDLPTLFIHAKGEVTASNMKEYGTALAARLVETRAIVLVTDQDFSNAKESAKVLRDQAKKVIAAQEAMLSQTASIGEVSLMLDAWAKDLNTTALDLENRVKKEDLLKKAAMIDKAKVYCQESFTQAEAGISPIRIILTQSPDFANAIKGKSKFESMQNGIDSVVAEFEIMIRSKVNDILLKQAFMKTITGFDFLFADMQSIIWKPMDDFKLLISSRIKTHEEAELAKRAAERETMRKEEEAKATEKARAELAAEQLRIFNEEQAAEDERKAKAEAFELAHDINMAALAEERRKAEAAKQYAETPAPAKQEAAKPAIAPVSIPAQPEEAKVAPVSLVDEYVAGLDISTPQRASLKRHILAFIDFQSRKEAK